MTTQKVSFHTLSSIFESVTDKDFPKVQFSRDFAIQSCIEDAIRALKTSVDTTANNSSMSEVPLFDVLNNFVHSFQVSAQQDTILSANMKALRHTADRNKSMPHDAASVCAESIETTIVTGFVFKVIDTLSYGVHGKPRRAVGKNRAKRQKFDAPLLDMTVEVNAQ